MFQSTRPRGARPPRQSAPRHQRTGFNPRARVGRDSPWATSSCAGRWFQSTRPRGARPHVVVGVAHHNGVSIHAPAWGATFRFQISCSFWFCFNPRARVGRDSCLAPKALLLPAFQSTRPRGARPQPFGHDSGHLLVSIHAPAWGATASSRGCAVRGDVSIHAPAWGATQDVSGTINRMAVSIHAPAWGATRRRRVNIGCGEFQSTRPRGARRGRPPCGYGGLPVSIHAPAWGATLVFRVRIGFVHVSIHAPAWGATMVAP